MADFLQPVGRGWRIACILGCGLASILSLLLSLLLSIELVRQQSIEQEAKPLWIAVGIVGLIGVASAFITWRLVRQHRAANGITTMPLWFIRLFGVLFLMGIIFVGYAKGFKSFLIEGMFVAEAMIFVDRRIARRQRNKT